MNYLFKIQFRYGFLVKKDIYTLNAERRFQKIF